MNIIIPSDKAAAITSSLGFPSWNRLTFQQMRQVATMIYSEDKSPEGKRIYDLLATGNSNANNFNYTLVQPVKKPIKWPWVIGAAIVLAIAMR